MAAKILPHGRLYPEYFTAARKIKPGRIKSRRDSLHAPKKPKTKERSSTNIAREADKMA